MRRLFILVIGLTVLLIGVVMVVTPGHSILVIPLGLAILGIEFAWARRWLAKFKSYLPKRNPFRRRPFHLREKLHQRLQRVCRADHDCLPVSGTPVKRVGGAKQGNLWLLKCGGEMHNSRIATCNNGGLFDERRESE